jgi:hypothetical protein
MCLSMFVRMFRQKYRRLRTRLHRQLHRSLYLNLNLNLYPDLNLNLNLNLIPRSYQSLFLQLFAPLFGSLFTSKNAQLWASSCLALRRQMLLPRRPVGRGVGGRIVVWHRHTTTYRWRSALGMRQHGCRLSDTALFAGVTSMRGCGSWHWHWNCRVQSGAQGRA